MKTKATRKLMILTVVLSMVISMSSCSILNFFAGYKQKVTAGNIELSLRDDMKKDTPVTEKGESCLACYSCDRYGMTVSMISGTSATIAGKTADDKLTETLEGKDNPTSIQKYNEISYVEYSAVIDGSKYLFTEFILDKGSEFYLIEFYTLSETSEKNMDQYQRIISGVKALNEKKAITEITIGGVNMTVDGDTAINGSHLYSCERYIVSSAVYKVPLNYSSEAFCRSTAEQGGYKTADQKDVTEFTTTEEGVSYFECYINGLYAYHYAKTEEKSLIYIYFFTNAPADEQLREDFLNIATYAKLDQSE